MLDDFHAVLSRDIAEIITHAEAGASVSDSVVRGLVERGWGFSQHRPVPDVPVETLVAREMSAAMAEGDDRFTVTIQRKRGEQR
jgi:hypothetical protein